MDSMRNAACDAVIALCAFAIPRSDRYVHARYPPACLAQTEIMDGFLFYWMDGQGKDGPYQLLFVYFTFRGVGRAAAIDVHTCTPMVFCL